MADIELIMSRLKQTVDPTRLSELTGYGALTFEDFHQMISTISQGRLTDHEIITLAR